MRWVGERAEVILRTPRLCPRGPRSDSPPAAPAMNEASVKEAASAWVAPQREQWRWWISMVSVVVLGFGLRATYYHGGYGHPDETITTEVVGHLRKSGDWDTNWAKATNLSVDLRYDQYNFSSHLLATYGFYRFVKVVPGTLAWRSEDAGFWVYRFFSVVLATLTVWQALRLAERVGGRGTAVGAGLLVAVAVQLVQDAHYSRPEAFVTMVTLAVVGCCWPREKLSLLGVACGAFGVGLLVACKVSMLVLVWMPLLPWLAGRRHATARARAVALVLVPLGLIGGFFVGAPGAIANPAAFVNGVEFLMNQYSGQHPPHSHLDGRVVADMLVAYYVVTLGWPVLACAGLGVGVLAWRRRWGELVVLAGPVLLFAGYFATRGVFFERNLSHVLPLFLILAAMGAMVGVEVVGGWLRRRFIAVATLSAVLLLGPSLLLTLPLLRTEFSGEGSNLHMAFEADLKAKHPGVAWKEVSLLNDGPLAELAERFKATPAPVLLRITDFNDEWNAYNLTLFAARFEAVLVADYPGTFARVPVCTLHTYHSPNDRYFLVTGLKLR